jgi:hypothetical protein
MAGRTKTTKVSGLKLDGEPNAAWRKFKERLEKYDSKPVTEWKAEELLGHICKRYRELGSEFEYALSYSGPPSKCKEIYCVRRMVLALGNEDPVISKNYIDWLFDTIIIPKKVTLTSVAYFFTDAFIRDFKIDRKKSKKVTRNTQIPHEFEIAAEELQLSIMTYGDLAFAKAAIDQDPTNEDYAPYHTLFQKLSSMGFDPNTLGTMDV